MLSLFSLCQLDLRQQKTTMETSYQSLSSLTPRTPHSDLCHRCAAVKRTHTFPGISQVLCFIDQGFSIPPLWCPRLCSPLPRIISLPPHLLIKQPSEDQIVFFEWFLPAQLSKVESFILLSPPHFVHTSKTPLVARTEEEHLFSIDLLLQSRWC